MVKVLENGSDFEKETAKGNVVVDFFATWCGPCRMMGQIISNIQEDFKDVTFLKVDCDKFPEISGKFGVSSIPNLFFFKNGNRISVKVDGNEESDLLGSRPEEDFRQILTDTFAL